MRRGGREARQSRVTGCPEFHVKPFQRACFGLAFTAGRDSLANHISSQALVASNGSVRWQKNG
jgi:hypothetical protein